jgi:hypothetical protein
MGSVEGEREYKGGGGERHMSAINLSRGEGRGRGRGGSIVLVGISDYQTIVWGSNSRLTGLEAYPLKSWSKV